MFSHSAGIKYFSHQKTEVNLAGSSYVMATSEGEVKYLSSERISFSFLRDGCVQKVSVLLLHHFNFYLT
jgi:hypothetical protein